MPPDHNLNDFAGDAAAPHAHRHPGADEPRRALPRLHPENRGSEAPYHGRAEGDTRQSIRIGIGGPVGSGKTALVAALCRTLGAEFDLAVVTNDIYTTEDADFLRRNAVLPDDRIEAVQTGCCPHTAIRDDITINLEAAEELERNQGPLELVLVESGGDNLTAVFSPALADVQIFVIDVAGGDDVPRKGGPGIARADLLVINKTDLAPYVGADVGSMLSDAAARRANLPVRALSLVEPPHAQPVAAWIRGQLAAFAQHGRLHSSATGAPHGHSHAHAH